MQDEDSNYREPDHITGETTFVCIIGFVIVVLVVYVLMKFFN